MRKKLQEITAHLTAKKAVLKACAWGTSVSEIRFAQDTTEDLRTHSGLRTGAMEEKKK